MEEKEDRIDFLLKSLIKMGALPIEDKIIDYFMDLPLEEEVPRAARKKSIRKLVKKQRELQETKKRLRNPLKLHSLGEYLKLIRKKERCKTMDVARRAGIDPNQLSLLEHDRISPLDFGLDEMARLVQSVGLSQQIATTLIRKSHQLFKIRPELVKVSARYDDKSGSSESRTDAMIRALRELMLKANARIAHSVSDPEIEDYLKELEKKLR